MKLTTETIFEFNKSSYNIIHRNRRLQDKYEPYDKMLCKVLEEVGDKFDFKDAQVLCYMGFFVSHESFNVDESMHAYQFKLYFEDGKCILNDRCAGSISKWMSDGWYIKATPDKINFVKLYKMHEDSGDYMLKAHSYEECLICPTVEVETDWLDDVIYCAHSKNKLWFRKGKGLIAELEKAVSDKSRKTIVLWSLSLANEVRDKLSHQLYNDSRPKAAIDMSTDWAFGRCKMQQARACINSCHSLCKDDISEIDSLYCHAIGQACSTVHTPKHAMGLPMYYLTAIAKLYGISNCKDAILERYEHYLDKLKFCEGQVNEYAGWADFMY